MTNLYEIPEPVTGVYITHELDERTPKMPNHLREKLALQDLAALMAQDPEKVLPRFVDLAMEITGGVSAGLSLLEKNPAPAVFRWQYLRGTLAPFNNATTPRDFSPCGVTLDCNSAVLSSHPERIYNWISDAKIVVPEVLLVPLYFNGSEPMGTLWIVSDQEGHFDRGHARAMKELATFVDMALRMLHSEQRLKRALDEQQTLAKEMNHRVKNLFAMTDGMIRLSKKEAQDKDDMARTLSGRLQSLARAHALASRDGGKDELHVLDFAALVQTILAPHERTNGSRFTISGPAVTCGERAVNAIALALHELATNAAKYGALMDEDGHVEVDWTADGDSFALHWTERGGPAIAAPPTDNGFGGTLVRMMIESQLGGVLHYDWRSSGLIATMIVPLAKLAG